MPRFVAKPLRSTRALRSGRQLSSTSTASGSTSFTATTNNNYSIRYSFVSGHFPPFDLIAVRKLLATRASSAVDGASTVHSFGGAESTLAEAATQGGTTTSTPPSTGTSSSYTSNTCSTANAASIGSSRASSAPTRYGFPVVTTEHLVNVFGYDLDKIIDLSPSSSMPSLASTDSISSKSSKVNTFGASLASRLRKMGASARNLVKLSSSASSIDSLGEKKSAQAQVVEVDSASSVLFDSNEESAVVGQPAEVKAHDYACEVLFDFEDEYAAFTEESTQLDALFAGEDEDDLTLLGSSWPVSCPPSLEAFDMSFFSAASDSCSRIFSNHGDDDDETPLARVKFNNILRHTATKAEGSTGFVCGSVDAGKNIGWELRDHSAGVCGVIEGGAAVSGSKEGKTARRGSRVWFS